MIYSITSSAHVDGPSMPMVLIIRWQALWPAEWSVRRASMRRCFSD